jgi:hypothetical protein
MIVLTCKAIPAPGQEAESQSAARELTESSKSHGMIDYFWNLDRDTQELHVVEVHQDESSVLRHIALSDVSRLAAVTTFADIRIYGDEPSQELLDVLSGFGEYKLLTVL